ncbi:MAG: beta-N-acetylhexosaminidase [Bacteroidota bacterium]
MKNKSPLLLLILFIFCFTQFSCEEEIPTDLTKSPLIPLPTSVTATGSSFQLSKGMSIYVDNENEEAKKVADYLANVLNGPTGFGIEVKDKSTDVPKGQIVLAINGDSSASGREGYELEIAKDQVKLTASNGAGLFMGIQTIRQLLPPEIESSQIQNRSWSIPTGTISDYPRYSHRGSMLDISRHFFGVDDIKRYIDFLAAFKMNVLHLHLTDDQGWRIEIKKWPNLTTHGGSTEVGGGQGGFLTQEDYTEIVQYAADRHILIIPEIDMPGHTNAALSSYPELNCDGKATELYTGTEVGFSSFCVDKEITYQFIDDVVKELAALTPGPYIHVGGDESHATKKEDYLIFINKAKDIVEKNGKRMMGWDETAQADLNKDAVVQLWNSPDFAKMAVDKGAKLLMSPAKKAYLDMQYDSTTHLGLHWAAYIEVDSGYIWDPATYLPGISDEQIIGVEAPLWSETVTNMDEIEYLVFPRLMGYAEIGWTPADKRNWEEYKVRLGKFAKRLEIMEIDYYDSKLVEWDKEEELVD